MKNKKIKLIGSSILISALVSGVILGTTANAAPVIKITPAKGLKNGQKVTVTGKGFTPKDNVFVLECTNSAKGEADCDITGAVPAKIDAKGNLPKVVFTVSTGNIGTMTCGTSKKDAAACDISVGNITGGDSTTGAIVFTVSK